MGNTRKSNPRPAMPAPDRDRSTLERSGLLNAVGGVTGAEASHPDAELLALIARFAERRDAAYALIRQAERYAYGGKRSKELWRQALADHPTRMELEAEIAETPARTRDGAIAKLTLALEGMDERGDGAAGSIWQVPISAVRDALAALAPMEVRT